jgi:hypothetical protein
MNQVHKTQFCIVYLYKFSRGGSLADPAKSVAFRSRHTFENFRSSRYVNLLHVSAVEWTLLSVHGWH